MRVKCCSLKTEMVKDKSVHAMELFPYHMVSFIQPCQVILSHRSNMVPGMAAH